MMLITTMSLLTVVAVQAAPQDTLTLQRAIQIAQDRGHQARAVRATRDASRYRDDGFRATLMPQLSLTGTLPEYNRSIVEVNDQAGTQFVSREQTRSTLGLQLSQRLPLTGGLLFVQSQLAQFQETGVSSFRQWSSTPFTIGLQQEILRPNFTGWNQREQSIRIGRDERVYLEGMEDVALSVTGLFFDAYAAKVALANAVTNAAVNDTLYRLNTGRYEVGRIGENDLLQSELALLRSRSALESARLEYDRTMGALRIALALPASANPEVVVEQVVPGYSADSTRAVTEARRNRALVSDLELQDVQAQRQVRQARAQYGVGATVSATYGYNNTAPSASLAYRDLLDYRRFSVAVTMPLWTWGAGASAVRAAKADQDRIESMQENAIETLSHEAKFAALELEQARRNVELLAKADSVAGRRFEVAYNRYGIGRITIDNLYIAQNEKDAALTQFVAGLRRYWQAHYRLRRTTLYDFQNDRAIR